MKPDLEAAGAVVTGGGNGIGRALAKRLAAHGARVLVNDLDADAARAVAEEVGGHAAPGDAASEQGIANVLATAHEHLGQIDVYCANAGVATGGGPEAPDADWQHAWEVNVMAHVRATRLLLPAWLERGRGTFVATASAAGLLTMLGSAPYSATKHATVGFAEWLSATYGHRGISVHCICPQGVRTGMLDDTGPAGDVLLRGSAIEPEQVADAFVEGLAEERFLILPHADVAGHYAKRASDTDRWLAAMRGIQQNIDAR